MDDVKYNLAWLLGDHGNWDPYAPLPHSGAGYEKVLLQRLLNDLNEVEEVSKGNPCSSIVRTWEQKAQNYSRSWKQDFKTTQNIVVELENLELIKIIQKLFWTRQYQDLGYVAEALFLKFISTRPMQESGCFHRLSSFALYDYYESSTRTFIDIKHSLSESYELKLRHLRNRANVVRYSKYLATGRNYHFAYIPLKIIEVERNHVHFQIRPLVTVEEAIKEYLQCSFKVAI